MTEEGITFISMVGGGGGGGAAGGSIGVGHIFSKPQRGGGGGSRFFPESQMHA